MENKVVNTAITYNSCLHCMCNVHLHLFNHRPGYPLSTGLVIHQMEKSTLVFNFNQIILIIYNIT